MMEVIDGDVVVVRDGDFVEFVIYRHLFKSSKKFFEEVKYLLEERKLENPNLCYMRIENNKFTPVKEGTFHAEYPKILKYFKLDSTPYCEKCASCVFAYFYDEKTYCPKCKG